MRSARRAVLAAAIAVVIAAPTMVFADEKVEGKVVRTHLTLCQPRPTGGGCEGTLTLEPKVGTAGQEMPIKVTADTLIKRDGAFVLLPSTQGSAVVVSYVTQKGERVAKTIDVVGAAR